MAGDWKETELGNCIRFVSGGTPSKGNPAFWGGSTPWISAKDMKTFWINNSEDLLTEEGMAAATVLVPPRSTLVLVRGMTLHNDVPIVRVRRQSAFNQDVKAALPKEGVVGEYVPYLLLGNKSALLEKVDAAGHGTGRLALDTLLSMSVKLPNETEQRAIASLLSALDDKIELNQRMAGTLEEMARTLYKSWFVNFDPVRFKAERRSTGLSLDVADLFPSDFNDRGFPNGWVTAPFGDLFDVRSGNTPSTEEPGYWGVDHDWATPRDLSRLNSTVLLTTERQLSRDGLALSNSGLLPSRSILLSTRAPIGYIAFAASPVAINQGMAGIVEKDISTAYAWLWCEQNVDTFISFAGGSTFPEISKSTLRALPMLRPSDGVLRAFAAQVDVIVDRIISLAKESRLYAELRAILLPKLISGELRIRSEVQKGAAA